jgi:hypothetical protein
MKPLIFLLPVAWAATVLSVHGYDERREVRAERVETAPVVDGVLDDACWNTAEPIGDFSEYSNADRMHPEQTTFQVCHNDEAIYLAVRGRVNEMEPFKARLDEAAGEFKYSHGGVFEIFFEPVAGSGEYQQYLLHSNGSKLITLSRHNILRTANDQFIQSATTLTDDGFLLEAAFPFGVLDLEPGVSDTWGFNVYRVHDLFDLEFDRDGFYSSWNSTHGNPFGTPEYFGRLHIDLDLSPFRWEVDLLREPQAGDDAIDVQLTNRTGSKFSGTLHLEVAPVGGEPSAYEQAVRIEPDESQNISFAHAVSAADEEALVTVRLTDADRNVRYVGGAQKRDLTPADAWEPPVPTDEEERNGFIAFARPWQEPVLYRSVPRAEERVDGLSIRLSPGEFEPVVFSLYPLRDAKAVPIRVSDLRGPDGQVIESDAVRVGRVTHQSVWENPTAFEAVEHLVRPCESVDLVAGRSRRLWLTVHAGDGVDPGTYAGTVSVGSREIPIEVDVLPIDLVEVEDMGYFMYHPELRWELKPDRDLWESIARDLADHGMTTATLYYQATRQDPETGKRVLADLDTFVNPSAGISYAALIDIYGKEGLGQRQPLIDVLAQYDVAHDPNLIVALHEEYKRRDWPKVAFYVNDEIEYESRIEEARRTLAVLEKAAPDMMTTTALGPKGAEALGEKYDIWIGCSRPEMIDFCNSLGKNPWTYSCRAVYEISPAFQRFFFGRFPWRIELKGVGLWAYLQDGEVFYDRFGNSFGYSGDFSFRPEWKHRYGFVLAEDGKIIPTVAWEGVREGIDDMRYLRTLEKAVHDAAESDAPAIRKAGKAGEELLDRIRARTDPSLGLNDKKHGRAWQAFGDLAEDRNQVIDAILAIQK